jgi:hypothetical protein
MVEFFYPSKVGKSYIEHNGIGLVCCELYFCNCHGRVQNPMRNRFIFVLIAFQTNAYQIFFHEHLILKSVQRPTPANLLGAKAH